jgi:hypothetical protein
MKLRLVTYFSQLVLVVIFAQIVILNLFLFYPITSYGQDLHFIWEYSQEEQEKINDFRLYNGNQEIIQDAIDKTARETTFNYEGGNCESFYLTAHRLATEEEPEAESPPSTIVAFCPDNSIPVMPGNFYIEGNVRLTPLK